MEEAGIVAYAEPPEAFDPPGAVIDFDNPFMTTDGGFATVNVHFNLYLLVNPSPNWENEVTAMTAQTIEAIRGQGFRIDSLGLYDTVDITGTTRVFQGALIKLAAEVAIKELV